MSLTPNYSFIIPTGSDAVNLLTQCYPNFTSLDSILKPIQESGVTVATDTKVGTVHQLVRTDSSCNMFRFIATGNYASGDTFTVDGASVTATAMDGTSLPAGAFVINQSVVCVLNNLVLTVLIAGKETSSLPASAVTYDNTVSGLTATNAQDAIDELHDSANIAYDNTVSGLIATDVQSAIDEIVAGEHGLFEKWVNPDPSLPYSASSITFTSPQVDALIFGIELGAGESSGVEWFELDTSYSTATLKKFFTAPASGNYPTVYQYYRTVTVSYNAGQYTITFTDCTRISQATNSTTLASAIDNTSWIPVRILGLVHNN